MIRAPHILAIAAAVGALGCNPYDELPPARCREAARDCRPGEHCRGGFCRAEHELAVLAASDHGGPWHAALIATPRVVDDPFVDRDARVIGVAHAPPSPTARMTLSRLPSLPGSLVVWRGAERGPCAGDPFSTHHVAAGMSRPLRLVLREEWSDVCLSLPRELRERDRFPFAAGRRAERVRASRD